MASAPKIRRIQHPGRVEITVRQEDILLEEYETNKYPTKERTAELAREIGYRQRYVKNWFIRQRSRNPPSEKRRGGRPKSSNVAPRAPNGSEKRGRGRPKKIAEPERAEEELVEEELQYELDEYLEEDLDENVVVTHEVADEEDDELEEHQEIHFLDFVEDDENVEDEQEEEEELPMEQPIGLVGRLSAGVSGIFGGWFGSQ